MKPRFNLADFSALLREFIRSASEVGDAHTESINFPAKFNRMALQLFRLQFEYNKVYGQYCSDRGVEPKSVTNWKQIPAIPTTAFKEFDLSCLPEMDRARVFHSSGTTAHQPSRHYHSMMSLQLYEDSLLPWFRKHLLGGSNEKVSVICLTPGPVEAPHSSLVHMFETVRRNFGLSGSLFTGNIAFDNSWELNHSLTLERLVSHDRPVLLLGPAFSYVHLIDYLVARDLKLKLPAQSRLLETGGYKGRTREVSRTDLNALLEKHLGVTRSVIISEYGMSELSSQAYDSVAGRAAADRGTDRVFRFPPWARERIISPETGAEVEVGKTGLIQVVDLANVYSVLAIQTGDLGVRCANGFELVGRATRVEPRGCSLMPTA